jgi:hypothetical protein
MRRCHCPHADPDAHPVCDADGNSYGLADRHTDSERNPDRDPHGDADRDPDSDRDTYGNANRDPDSERNPDRDSHGDADPHADPRAGCDAAAHFGRPWAGMAQQAPQSQLWWAQVRNGPWQEGRTMSVQASLSGRLELKYVVDEMTAARVCRQLEPYCSLDVHGGSHQATDSPVSGYPVSSLYLDTPGFAFHRAKERGDSERFKLRVRGYQGSQVLYLEIKHRSADFVYKRRVGFDWRNLAEAGHEMRKLHEETPQGRRVAEEFGRRVLSSAASPKLLVRYQRVAYASDVDHYARVTFDRNIEFQQAEQWNFEGRHGAWRDLQSQLIADAPNPLVIMEIKTGAAIPRWLIDIVRRNELRRSSVSKYSLGIYLTYRFRYLSPGRERARGLLV